jgi:hypothetical protein
MSTGDRNISSSVSVLLDGQRRSHRSLRLFEVREPKERLWLVTLVQTEPSPDWILAAGEFQANFRSALETMETANADHKVYGSIIAAVRSGKPPEPFTKVRSVLPVRVSVTVHRSAMGCDPPSSNTVEVNFRVANPIQAITKDGAMEGERHNL